MRVLLVVLAADRATAETELRTRWPRAGSGNFSIPLRLAGAGAGPATHYGAHFADLPDAVVSAIDRAARFGDGNAFQRRLVRASRLGGEWRGSYELVPPSGPT